jgi:hypothetical protein
VDLMHALVVFESMYGNTKAIAEAIAAGLSSRIPVEVAEVGAAPAVLDDDVSLLVVGAPTHAHGLSSPGTRRSAAERTDGSRALESTSIGLREWLAELGASPSRVAVATFDTRIKGPAMLTGSAAKSAEGQLRKAGAHVLAPAQSFFLARSRGSVYDALAAGELDRARTWGERLATELPD